MLRRIDRLADLGTTIITLSGGEPTLHPDLDAIIRRIRDRGAIATLITNGLLLTPKRIRALNRAGLDYLQISIDNLAPDDVSKKSLRRARPETRMAGALRPVRRHHHSVLGAGVRNPDDAIVVGQRARELGFTSTVGILHDPGGQLQPLAPDQRGVYDRFRRLQNRPGFPSPISIIFRKTSVVAWPTIGICRAGGRFSLHLRGRLVHYCSQQRGHPASRLKITPSTTSAAKPGDPKRVRPSATISCVHQNAMLDEFRERPKDTLAGILDRRRALDPQFHPPALVGMLSWLFLDERRRGFFGN